MCMPRFLHRVLKRKKSKSKRIIVDTYQRDIIESPRTPPDSTERIPVCIELTGKESSQWTNTPRSATPTRIATAAETSYESKRARYGGNGSSREGNFPENVGEMPVLSEVSPVQRRASLPRAPSPKATPVRPPTPPRKRSSSYHPRTQQSFSQDQGDHRRDCGASMLDLNSRPLPPLPGTRTRSVTFTDCGSRFDEGSSTRPNPKSNPSFEVPGSWDELARSVDKNWPQAENMDDLAIAIGVRAMISSTPATSAVDMSEGNVAVGYTEETGDSSRVLQLPDCSFDGRVPEATWETAPSKDRHTGIPFPPGGDNSSCSSVCSVESPLPSPTSLDFTPRTRRRTDSSVYLATPVKSRSPGRATEYSPHGPDPSNFQNTIAFPLTPTSVKSAAKRPLPLTPASPSRVVVQSTTAEAGVRGVAKSGHESVGATATGNSAYPTPDSSLGRK